MARKPHAGVVRWARRFVVLVVLAGVISPVVRDRDSFPLSTYPMYASVRPRQVSFDRVVGVGADGSDRALPMQQIAATDDPLIAEERISDAVAAGRADELCRRVAARVSDDVELVLVVRERHDVVEAAAGGDSRRSRAIHARCRPGR